MVLVHHLVERLGSAILIAGGLDASGLGDRVEASADLVAELGGLLACLDERDIGIGADPTPPLVSVAEQARPYERRPSRPG